MKLHFLGTTGYHPNDKRQTACMMLPELGLIFDAGTGMYRVRDLIQTDTLDIVLSHVHLDHSIGLTFLYDILWEKNVSRVTVHADSKKIDVIRRHLYNEFLFPVKPNFELRPFGSIEGSEDGSIELSGGHTIQTMQLEHPGGSHGFRLEGPGTSMAYITDTTARDDAEYVSKIANVGTLIHECYFPDGMEDRAALTGHSCLTPVAQIAAQAKVERVFLVHINPLDESDSPFDLDSVKSIYGPIQVASDRQVIEL